MRGACGSPMVSGRITMPVPPPPQPRPFEPVGETLRRRAERHWHGDVWPTRALAALCAVTMVAAVLRLWHLEDWSVSAVEAATWRSATTGAVEAGPAPLAGLLLRAAFALGLLPEHGEGWLRLPFAFFGVLTVPLLAVVADVFVGRRVAILAAGLLALHPWHVEASQTASGAVVACFCFVLAAGFAALGTRLRSRLGLLLALLAAICAVGCDAAAWWPVLGVLAAAALGSAPSQGRVVAIGAAVLGAVAAAALLAAGEFGGGVGAAGACLGGMLGDLRPAVWCCGVLGWLVWPAGPGRDRSRARTVAVAVAPLLALPWLAAAGTGDPAIVRDGLAGSSGAGALVALPAWLAAVAVGVDWSVARLAGAFGGLGVGSALPAVTLGLAVVGDLVVATFLYATVHDGGRPDWRGACELVLRAARSRQVVVLGGEGTSRLLYYLRPQHWRDPAVDAHPGFAVHRVGSSPFGDALDEDAKLGTGPAGLFVVLQQREVDADPPSSPGAVEFAAVFRRVGVLPDKGDVAGTIHVFARRADDR